MSAPIFLTPKKRAALIDCAAGILLRCDGGYKLPGSQAVHTKRVVNQLATEGLVTVSHFERDVTITTLGRDTAQVIGPQAHAA